MKKLLVVTILLWSASAFAGTTPAFLNYQGYLTDVDGTPVTGDWTVTFKFFPQSSGGTPFFTEARDVAAELGVFSALLGTKPENPLNPASFESGEAWLELTVAPKGAAGVTMQPRQRVVSNPYAFWSAASDQCREADNALSFGGAAPNAFVTLAALPQLCVSPEVLAQRLAELGLEAYGDEDVAAYLAAAGIAPYGDDEVAAYLEAAGISAYGDLEVTAYLAAAGIGPYGDPEVAAYLEANGYLPGGGSGGASTWDELQGKPQGLLTEASAAASGLFLMADGSVVATGDLDLGGNSLLNVVIQNSSAAEAPEAPVMGQLWYDTDEQLLKVYGQDAWVSLGNATGLDCEGCVDDADVSFPTPSRAPRGARR
jgi:hypothetical protein